ncbi:MAG: hypothetical protein OXJ90_22965 [Spirochaetaceae bacterium]|nr:hypothetical protein [Spirochaetaceae bacterium]
MELLLMAPVLTGLVLFVLWAADSGRVGLTTTLAAEDASVAAGEMCIGGENADGDRIDGDCAEAVAEAVVAARTPPEANCVADARVGGDGRAVTVDVSCESDAPGRWGIASDADSASRRSTASHIPKHDFTTDTIPGFTRTYSDNDNQCRGVDGRETFKGAPTSSSLDNYSETYPIVPSPPASGSAEAAKLFTYVEIRPWEEPKLDADGNQVTKPKLDADGNQATDEDGNALTEPVSEQQFLCLRLNYGQTGPPDKPVSAYLRGLGRNHSPVVFAVWTKNPSSSTLTSVASVDRATCTGGMEYGEIPAANPVHLWLSPAHEQELDEDGDPNEYRDKAASAWNNQRTWLAVETCGIDKGGEPEGEFEVHAKIVSGGTGGARFVCPKLGATICQKQP